MRGARRWIGYLALVIVFSIGCVMLASWQFQRLDDARTRLERIETNWDAAAVPIAQLLPVSGGFDEAATWHPVVATGRYLVDQQLLARGRPRDGKPGFEVLVPFLLNDGRIVIVDRGWVPVGAEQDAPDNVPIAPAGDLTLVLRLKPGEAQLPGRGAPTGQVATINLPAIAELLGGDVNTSAFGLLDTEQPAADDAPLVPARPVLDEGPHLSYALQWIVFAIMAFGALIWAIRNEKKVRSGIDPSDRSRRSVDDDEEDAIIDRQNAELG